MHLHVIRTFPAKLFTAGSIPPSIPSAPAMVKAVWSERRAQLLYYQDRMRALAFSSLLGLLLAGLAVPEHSNPAFEVVRVLWSDFSPEPRSDKRVHFGLGSESLAKSIEIHWPSGMFQTLENISGDQVLQIDEPARGAARR
jgi:hypothetical protein